MSLVSLSSFWCIFCGHGSSCRCGKWPCYRELYYGSLGSVKRTEGTIHLQDHCFSLSPLEWGRKRVLYQLWEGSVLDCGYISFSKNQVYGNSEVQGPGLLSGFCCGCVDLWVDVYMPSQIELGWVSDPVKRYTEGYNWRDLFFHHHHPVFWVGPASDFRGRVERMVLWRRALGCYAKSA